MSIINENNDDNSDSDKISIHSIVSENSKIVLLLSTI